MCIPSGLRGILWGFMGHRGATGNLIDLQLDFRGFKVVPGSLQEYSQGSVSGSMGFQGVPWAFQRCSKEHQGTHGSQWLRVPGAFQWAFL